MSSNERKIPEVATWSHVLAEAYRYAVVGLREAVAVDSGRHHGEPVATTPIQLDSGAEAKSKKWFET